MPFTSDAYYWLAGGLVGALLIDLVATRLYLEVLRPASAYVFHAGRAGKLTALGAWLAFLVGVWYPRFMVGERQLAPEWLTPVAVGIFVAGLAVAVLTLPRPGTAPARAGGGRRGGDA